MKVDLLHNKIIRDTATPRFLECVKDSLIPMLEAEYGEGLDAVQMYEDYLSLGFSKGGYFYYPVTVVVEGSPARRFVKWSISEYRRFESKIPYAYISDIPLKFSFAEAPEGFAERLSGRALYFDGDAIPLNIDTTATDKTFLSGKYSQTFVDEMARQITAEIERAFSIPDLKKSSLELFLVFAPGTYMEHVVDATTYRRLLISAKGCSSRDLWIKWYKKGSSAPVTVSDNLYGEEVVFEISEDVPQKIREKEYRFLVHSSHEKYQNAMGRKHITEWRELMKRVIKRGEVEKLEAALESPERDAEIEDKLKSVLSIPAESVSEPQVQSAEDDYIKALLRGALGVTEQSLDEEETAEEAENTAIPCEEIVEKPEEVHTFAEAFEELLALDEKKEESPEESVAVNSESADDAYAAHSRATFDEEELRIRIEREIREKLEAEARAKAEREASELRAANDALKAENERLAGIIKEKEDVHAANINEREEEAKRLRLELDAKERAERAERERLAEMARVAVMERDRLDEMRKEEEARAKEREECEAREREAAAAEEARLAEIRRIEEERLARAREAEAERARAEEARAKSAVTYISKNARLIFRRHVDSNVVSRIHEIIVTTIKYFHKENVYMKIKATVPDANTVNLNFVKIPEQESELLINIIKVLGKSDLGITKVYLE